MPEQYRGPFNYFNGCNAAYVETGTFGAIKSTKLLFPSAFVLSGDTCGIAGGNLHFNPLDADKDDYSQNCVGGAADESITEFWQIHAKGQNVMFADGHAKWYKGFNPGEMTFGYNAMTNWMTRIRARTNSAKSGARLYRRSAAVVSPVQEAATDRRELNRIAHIAAAGFQHSRAPAHRKSASRMAAHLTPPSFGGLLWWSQTSRHS